MNKQTKLTLEIIESYGFEKRVHKPDWDDTALEITLPNGLVLETLTQCNNHYTPSDSLEGCDGYIYIETKEELDDLIKLTEDELDVLIESFENEE